MFVIVFSPFPQVFAEHGNLALETREQTGEYVLGSGFPRTAGAQKTEDFPGRNGERPSHRADGS